MRAFFRQKTSKSCTNNSICFPIFSLFLLFRFFSFFFVSVRIPFDDGFAMDSSGKVANDDCSSNWLFLWLGKVGTKKKLPPCSMRLRHTQTVGIFEPCYYRASPRLQTQLLQDPYSSEASSLKAKQDSGFREPSKLELQASSDSILWQKWLQTPHV